MMSMLFSTPKKKKKFLFYFNCLERWSLPWYMLLVNFFHFFLFVKKKTKKNKKWDNKKLQSVISNAFFLSRSSSSSSSSGYLLFCCSSSSTTTHKVLFLFQKKEKEIRASTILIDVLYIYSSQRLNRERYWMIIPWTGIFTYLPTFERRIYIQNPYIYDDIFLAWTTNKQTEILCARW